MVIVDGRCSQAYALSNSVYQGTVLGPPLWNVFYEDSQDAAHCRSFSERAFADDLNCLKLFDVGAPSIAIHNELRNCQASLHEWEFEATKESFHILHPKCAEGDNFKLLGLTFDTKLVMNVAAHEVAVEAGWRLKALLRCKRFFDERRLVRLFKSQVLSYIEARTTGLYHAPAFFLARVDQVHARFLEEIDLEPVEVLSKYNLPPTCTRRDIFMMGLLHRVVLGKAPPQYQKFIHFATSGHFNRGWAFRAPRHSRQLYDPVDGSQPNIVERSILGLTHTYNVLPQRTVDCKNVPVFKRALLRAVQNYAATGAGNWDVLLKHGVRCMSPSIFQNLFP